MGTSRIGGRVVGSAARLVGTAGRIVTVGAVVVGSDGVSTTVSITKNTARTFDTAVGMTRHAEAVAPGAGSSRIDGQIATLAGVMRCECLAKRQQRRPVVRVCGGEAHCRARRGDRGTALGGPGPNLGRGLLRTRHIRGRDPAIVAAGRKQISHLHAEGHVNHDQPGPRQRFTVAHELGHLVCHIDEPLPEGMMFVDARSDTGRARPRRSTPTSSPATRSRLPTRPAPALTGA